MSAFWAIAKAGFNEARRNRVTLVVAAFAVGLILMTTLVLNLTIYTLDRIVTDFGLGVMSLLLVALSVFLSAGMLSREIEKRTVFLVMSRPVWRELFAAARYAGMALTLTMLEAAMTLVYFAQLLIFEVPFNPAIGWALLGLWVEVLLLAAVGLFLSSFSGSLVAAGCTVGVYLLGHASPELYTLSQRVHGPLKLLALIAYRVTPNLDQLDFKPEASQLLTVDTAEALQALGTGVLWLVVFVSATALVFRRRDFR